MVDGVYLYFFFFLLFKVIFDSMELGSMFFSKSSFIHWSILAKHSTPTAIFPYQLHHRGLDSAKQRCLKNLACLFIHRTGDLNQNNCCGLYAAWANVLRIRISSTVSASASTQQALIYLCWLIGDSGTKSSRRCVLKQQHYNSINHKKSCRGTATHTDTGTDVQAATHSTAKAVHLQDRFTAI